MAPGSSFMETPAILCDTGSCLTVASLAEPPGPTQPFSLSMSYLKGSSSSAFVSSDGAAFTCSAIAAVAAKPSETRDMASNKSRRLISSGIDFLHLLTILTDCNGRGGSLASPTWQEAESNGNQSQEDDPGDRCDRPSRRCGISSSARQISFAN